ncbi:DUF192 domain-containing protein [Pacificibacter maritimus]|nr:DUF192 domain-containing protein [Pacificibacter maritimus]
MITLSIALGAQASFGQGRHQGEGQGAASASNAPLCDPNTVQIVTQDGPVPFSIALAQTAAERSRGLMYVASMPEDMGMLFVYEKAGPVSFWMKNTLIPLDMIFTDTRGVIVSIHKNAIPHDETPIFGGNAIFSVLELNAGVSEAKNIKIGDVLLHPAYDFYTSLPCGAK